MKTIQLKKPFLLALLAVSFVTMSCTNGNNNKQSGQNAEENVQVTSNPKFEDAKVNNVYQHYIHLKTALVNSDNTEAKSGATLLEKALNDAGQKNIALTATKIKNSDAIEEKRAQLSEISTSLGNYFKKSKLTSGIIYKQHCPMANDGNGGYWLASEAEIKNPYYGESMLKCGSVEEEIK